MAKGMIQILIFLLKQEFRSFSLNLADLAVYSLPY